MAKFGNRAYKKVIKGKWGHKDEVLIWWDWYPDKKRKRTQDLSPHTQNKDPMRTQLEGGCLQATEASPDTEAW